MVTTDTRGRPGGRKGRQGFTWDFTLGSYFLLLIPIALISNSKKLNLRRIGNDHREIIIMIRDFSNSI